VLAQLVPEIVEVLFAQAAFQESARVDPGEACPWK